MSTLLMMASRKVDSSVQCREWLKESLCFKSVRIEVEINETEIKLTGIVRSYYQKQMVQELIKTNSAYQSLRIVNKIVVCY